MQDFDTALTTFIAGCQEIIDLQNLAIPATLVNVGGRRYRKIAKAEYGKVSSVYCFVDTTNGNVLKPASWKAPAKHARGNIFDNHNGLRLMSWTGPAYL